MTLISSSLPPRKGRLAALPRRWRLPLPSLAVASCLVVTPAQAQPDAGAPPGADQERAAQTELFARQGDAYLIDNWNLFLAISANDLVAFAAQRHPEVKAELENLDPGTFHLEEARKRIKGTKTFREELAVARAGLSQATFVATANGGFGLQHLGGGHFFLFVAGGSQEEGSAPIVEALFPKHPDFSMAAFGRYRKIVDHDGPMWGVDLRGMPSALSTVAEDNLPDGNERWSLQWRWHGLGRVNHSWRRSSDNYGRVKREPTTIYTMDRCPSRFLTRTAKYYGRHSRAAREARG